MALTLTAEQKSIYDIFSGENQYVIPPYQRTYSWTNVQSKVLFEDIKRAYFEDNDDGYFLGNMVLARSKEEKNRLEVIDGQQRLTTLILLLKVLFYFDNENKALYDAIWIKDRRTNDEMQRVETDIFMEQDFNYFKEVLALDFSKNSCENMTPNENLFKKNICYFYNELKEFSKYNNMLKFADFVMDYVYILPIEIKDSSKEKAREKALQIFETINDRGLNLSTSDIFKARLYSMALNELKHKDFIEKWNKLSSNCDNLNCKVDDIFKKYGYIIRGENGIIGKKGKLREFFLNKSYSPFFNKKYNEIIDNLLQISNTMKLYKDVCINPNKYGEITKWFQVIKLFKDEKMNTILIIYLYKNNLKLDSSLIDFCLNFIRYSQMKKVVYQDEFFYPLDMNSFDNNKLIIDIMYNKKFTYYDNFRESGDFPTQEELLLSFYLDLLQKPIFPLDSKLKELELKLPHIFDEYSDYIEKEQKEANEKVYKDRLENFFRNPNEN